MASSLRPASRIWGGAAASIKYRFVSVEAANQVDYEATETNQVDGISWEDGVAPGNAIAVIEEQGVEAKLEVLEAVSAGDILCPGTAGKGKIADTATWVSAAKALKDGSGDGAVVPVIFLKKGAAEV